MSKGSFGKEIAARRLECMCAVNLIAEALYVIPVENPYAENVQWSKHPVVIYNLARMEATRFSRGAKGGP